MPDRYGPCETLLRTLVEQIEAADEGEGFQSLRMSPAFIAAQAWIESGPRVGAPNGDSGNIKKDIARILDR